MSTQKVLYFLEMMKGAVKGFGPELDRLQENAVRDDPDIQRLQSLLDCAFFGESGRALRERGAALLDRIYTYPEQAGDRLCEVRQMNESIQREADLGRALLCSPAMETRNLTVAAKGEAAAGLPALRQVAAVSAHLIAVYQGPEALKPLSWNEANGIQARFRLVNDIFLPQLWRQPPPQYGWVIRKQRLGGGMLLEGWGFTISYVSSLDFCSGNMPYGSARQEPCGSHGFFDPSVWAGDMDGQPCCWGVGHLVSGSPTDGLALLQGEVVVRPRVPRPDETLEPLPGPMECLRRLTEGRPFCITPEDLTTALNQWWMGGEIERRKRGGLCLLCGKPVKDGRLSCPGHFASEWR